MMSIVYETPFECQILLLGDRRFADEAIIKPVNNIAIRPFDYHIVDDPDIRFGVFPTLLQSGEMRNVGFYFTIALNAPNIRMKNLTLLDPQLS